MGLCESMQVDVCVCVRAMGIQDDSDEEGFVTDKRRIGGRESKVDEVYPALCRG